MGRLMRVQGHSMLPLLRPGAVVLVDERAYRRRPPRLGDVVVARPAALGGEAVVKRVAAQTGDGSYLLLGDHTDDSFDSHRFGAVTPQELLGPVRLRLWPPKVL